MQVSDIVYVSQLVVILPSCAVYMFTNINFLTVCRMYVVSKYIIKQIYTLNHKKRDILFLTITLANLNRFLQFLYHFNREEILRATIIKSCHLTRFMCAPYLEKSKLTFLP